MGSRIDGRSRGGHNQGGYSVKCLIITGASAGIGLHTAQRFLDEGYAVINLSADAARSMRSAR